MKKLMVGAAKRNIDVRPEMLPFPSAANPRCVGIITPCSVRACVIDNGETELVILSFDIGGIRDDSFKKAVSEATGIPAGHIINAATHNHTGAPAFARNPEEQAAVDRYNADMRGAAVQAVLEARATKRPARYGFGEGRSYINANRDLPAGNSGWTQGPNYEAYCDHNLYTMKFVDEEGQLICALVSFGMHATLACREVDWDGQSRSSGNIPGVAADHAESRLGGKAVVLWFSEAAGDQNPFLYCLRDYDEKDGFPFMARLFPGSQFQLVKIMGKQHGEDIVRSVNAITRYNENMPISITENEIPVPTHRIVTGEDEMVYNDLANAVVRLPEGEEMPATEDAHREIPLYMQQAVLGDVAIVGVAAEIYSKIGKDLHDASPFRKTMVLTHVGPSAGYILDKGSVDHRCFQFYSKVTPGSCDEKIVENELRLFDKMMGGR